jgi:phospholipid transport system substrate-binding protein
MISRRLFSGAVLFVASCLLFAVPAHADADFQPAKDLVSKLSKQAVEVMTSKSIADKDRIERFRTLFISSVDLPVISRFVLGRHWKIATPDQQQEFMKLFEDMLVYTWAVRFKEANDQISVQVNGTKSDSDQGVIVDSAILRQGQDPVPVLWRLRQTDGSYRIIDLLIEGTSMIVTYREEYASVINQNGGNITGLLEILRKKVGTMAQQQASAQ